MTTRRAALVAFWGLTVALAALAGWFAARLDTAPELGAVAYRSPSPRPSPVTPPTKPSLPPPAPFEPARSDPTDSAPAEVEPPPVVKRAPKPEPVEPDPPPAAATEVVPVVAEPLPPVLETVPEPAFDVGVELDHAARLFAEGDYAAARETAQNLLGEYEDFSGLTAAFAAQGADTLGAQLDALRVLHLGGMESVSVELARELKRSYSSTPAVMETLREYKILKPRITSVESIVENDRVVVHGSVENPDVGVVRRVTVQVDALDAAGNVIASTTTRVQPRGLDPAASGSFRVRFDDLDPEFVLRTRATVVKWQSEVL